MKPLTLAILLFLSVSAFAQTVNVTFTWDRNPEPDVYDYVLKIGTAPGVYTTIAPVTGDIKKTVALPINTLHYVVVCAVNSSGLTSLPSNERAFQVFTPGNGKVPTPPVGIAKPPALQARLEMSTDLKSGIWQTVCTKTLPNQPNTFVRVVAEAIN